MGRDLIVATEGPGTRNMYPIAHIVAATGAAWSAERVARRVLRRQEATARQKEQARANSWSLFDYRLVALGAWLPDIIDKPLGWWVLDDGAYEHSFAHSLLFATILTLPGLFFARRGDRRLLSIAFGDVMHLLCDPVMRAPQILLWPLLGWTFEGGFGYAVPIAVNLMTLDAVVGAMAAVVLLRLWHRDRLRALLQWGRL